MEWCYTYIAKALICAEESNTDFTERYVHRDILAIREGLPSIDNSGWSNRVCEQEAQISCLQNIQTGLGKKDCIFFGKSRDIRGIDSAMITSLTNVPAKFGRNEISTRSIHRNWKDVGTIL